MATARHIHIKGLVQGVGFRPFIYRHANKFGLHGWVENRNDGVIVQVEGPEKVIDQFIASIETEKPLASNIFSIDHKPVSPNGFDSFFIKKSENQSDDITEVSPDIAVCPECLADLKLQDHRINYPFINCTNCGPRFTIIRDLPYDRIQTTMEPFTMCDVCRNEFENILDRRFHAQPVACNTCGPVYELRFKDKIYYDFNEIIKHTCTLLEAGKIIAIKGMGGFHLACDALNEEAVKELRKRKNRDGKPFAVMFSDLDVLKEFLHVTPDEEKQLLSWRSPILLLRNRNDASQLAPDISVGFGTTGAMLPYMPFHHLLFERLKLKVIVLTSGNISDEPIIIDNNTAIEQLGQIADAFLTYNRDIYNRTDDSVVMSVNGSGRLIRRSRGYVPNPVQLNLNVDGILATGAELVNTFCIGKGNQAFLSQHIGDLKNPETLEFFEESIDRFKKLFRAETELVVCDMHPDYLSTKYAIEVCSSPPHSHSHSKLIQVQHHHAHIASCMAEHGLDEKVIGVSLDGVGYGDDGHIWGGEFMICDLLDFERKTHFDYIPMPGGDKATKEPWRMGVSYLYKFFGKDFLSFELPFLKNIPRNDIDLILLAIEKNINCPLTSSTGRLFDAVSAICNLCTHASFHAEAPMRLEQAIKTETDVQYDFTLGDTILMESTIKGIVADLQSGVGVSEIAVRFHNTIIQIIFDVVLNLQNETGIQKVVLSGGSFQNKYILERVEKRLEKLGFEVFSQHSIPANDGGIALGQLAIAAKRRALEND